MAGGTREFLSILYFPELFSHNRIPIKIDSGAANFSRQ